MQTMEPVALPPLIPASQVAAATLIRQRRSCLALDGKTSISAETFYHMLDSLLPRPGVPPWDTLPWEPHLHLGIFHPPGSWADAGFVLVRTERGSP